MGVKLVSRKVKAKRSKKEWSPDGYLLAAFRKVFRWSPERRKALARAFKYKKGKIEFYECEECHEIVPRKEKQVDHTSPVILPQQGFIGYDDLRRRMFVSAVELKVLCKKCHQKKTQAENKIRRQVKKDKNEK